MKPYPDWRETEASTVKLQVTMFCCEFSFSLSPFWFLRNSSVLLSNCVSLTLSDSPDVSVSVIFWCGSLSWVATWWNSTVSRLSLVLGRARKSTFGGSLQEDDDDVACWRCIVGLEVPASPRKNPSFNTGWSNFTLLIVVLFVHSGGSKDRRHCYRINH